MATVNVLPLGARTTSTQSAVFGSFPRAVGAVVQVRVAAVSGTTPTLQVFLQESVDGVNFDSGGTSGAVLNSTTTQLFRINNPMAKYFRVFASVGGTTPSFTFEVYVEVIQAGR